MRWRLLLEEFGPKIVYIKGTDNTAADALSRLPRDDDSTPAEVYSIDDEDRFHSDTRC